MEISWRSCPRRPAPVVPRAVPATPSPARPTLFAGALAAIFHRGCFATHSRRRARSRSDFGGGFSDELPPYCGRLVAPELDLLIIGVAHFDGGISGKSARKMIQKFRPRVCLVELDQQRFSRLLAHRRGLPWPYLPKRGSSYQPSPFARSMREVLYSGLELAQTIVGNKERGGGDEFYQAFLAAESSGAIVVPGDLQIPNALDSLAKAIRHGLTQPLQQIAAGANALGRALGGFGRPEYTGDFASATGIAFPAALVADGGGRALPLARAAALGFVVLNVLSFAMGGNGMDENIEGLRRMDVQGLSDVATALLGVLISLVVGSSFMISYLESRDSHMASRILQVAELVDKEAAGVVHCRWVKSAWAAIDSEPRNDGTQVLPEEVIQRAADAPQGQSSVQQLSFRQRPKDAPGDTWLALFTVRRPLGDGEVRNFSLFEPRFLRLFDELKVLGHAKPGLRLAVAFAPLGIERPSRLWQHSSEAPQAPQQLPPLAVEVEVMLDPQVRIVVVEEISEGLGEDQRRRWRLAVRGTAEVFPTAASEILSDEFGALWTVPPGANAESKAPEKASQRQSRCVAVVGLMHVNSMLEKLQAKLERERGEERRIVQQTAREQCHMETRHRRLWPVVLYSLALPAFIGPQSKHDMSPRAARHPHVHRTFFQNTWADRDYMDRQFFVADTLHVLLPAAKRNAQLKAVELEPTDGRYIAFLRPGAEEVAKKRWYLDEYIAIGHTLWEAESDQVKKLKKEANAQGAKPRFQAWTNPSERWMIQKGSIDMALLADGSVERLGSRLQAAMAELKRVLKPGGRLYVIASDEDTKGFQGQWQDGMKGSVFDQAGFELVAAKKGECGLTIGYWRKKGVRKKKSQAREVTSFGVDPKQLSALLDGDD